MNYRIYKVTIILYLGKTSLMYAARLYYTDTETTRILLEHGADVNSKDNDG